MNVKKMNKMYVEVPNGYNKILHINLDRLKKMNKNATEKAKLGRYLRYLNNLMYHFGGNPKSVFNHLKFNLDFNTNILDDDDIKKHLSRYVANNDTMYLTKKCFIRWDNNKLREVFDDDEDLIIEYKQRVGASLSGQRNHNNKINMVTEYLSTVDYTSVKDIVNNVKVSNKTVIGILKGLDDTSMIIDDRVLNKYKVLYKLFNDITLKGNRFYTNEDIIKSLKGKMGRMTYYNLMKRFDMFQIQLKKHNDIMISNQEL